MFNKTRIYLDDLNPVLSGSAIGEGSRRESTGLHFSALHAAFRKGRPYSDGVYGWVTALQTRSRQ
jgi:hypothetical protein